MRKTATEFAARHIGIPARHLGPATDREIDEQLHACMTVGDDVAPAIFLNVLMRLEEVEARQCADCHGLLGEGSRCARCVELRSYEA